VKENSAEQLAPKALEELGFNHQIGNSSLVFERDEAEPFGGRRALAADHHPSHAHFLSRLASGELLGGYRSDPVQLGSQQCQRVLLQAQTHRLVIGAHPLGRRHRR